MPDPLLAVNYTWYGYDLTPVDRTRRIQVVEGLRSGPPLRGSDVTIGGLPGADAMPREADILPLLLAGSVEASGVDPTARVDAFEAIVRELQRQLRPSRGPGPLVATFRDGLVLTTQAYPVDQIAWGEQPLPARKLTIRAASAEGYWFGPVVVDAARPIPASPTAFVLAHPGTEVGHDVVLDFLGPITNPRVTNLTTGTYVEFLGAVAATQRLVLDGADFTALNNGLNAIGSVRYSGDPRWLLIAPGNNNLQVTGSAMTAATRLDLTFRPPYL